MKVCPKVGLLPLYLRLYDEAAPDAVAKFEPFIGRIVGALEAEGLAVSRGAICRVEDQFRKAVDLFEAEEVDLIVTLHLAYSPSLESVDVLAGTRLPILMLDTTMDGEFGPGTHPDRIMYNHGIHGVQDLASMLRRRGKGFEIVAGHMDEGCIIPRAAACAEGAKAARQLGQTKALRIGQAFKGMGDFSVEEKVLREVLGVSVKEVTPAALAEDAEGVTAEAVEEEVQRDRERFVIDVPDEVHRRSVRVGLAVRSMLERESFTAFSMSFLAFDSAEGPLNTVPFLEASKAMERGAGYAGEGDVLTAALVGALNRAFGSTSFTEIFCPDWKGGTLFLSHMGEVNPAIAAGKPRVFEKAFPYTPAENPAVLTCSVKPGPATLVNLAPGPNDTFGLVVSAVEVLSDEGASPMGDVVRAWVRPGRPLGEFLELYSRHGGTHHSALMLGNRVEAVKAFGAFAGLGVEVV